MSNSGRFDQAIGNAAPSAPPIEDEVFLLKGVVQPFQIVSAESYPITYIVPEEEINGETVSNSGTTRGGNSYNPALQGRAAAHRNAKRQSENLDRRIAKGNADGVKLVHEEKIVKHRSNAVGMKESASLDRRIEASNSDQVEDTDIHTAHLALNPAVAGSSDKAYKVDPYKIESCVGPSGGYQIPEYRSMYEDSAGGMKYETQDYKSIYD